MNKCFESQISCCEECCCEGTECGKKVLQIEYLYLDLNTCDRCIGTDAVLDSVVDKLRPALELAGYEVQYKKHKIATARIAKKYRFKSSPTILVNGRDIFGTILESDCGCCGDIAGGVQVDCRVFPYQGKVYEVPTEEMLADAVLRSLGAAAPFDDTEYELPENLKRFFEGKSKMKKSACSCGCSCSCGH